MTIKSIVTESGKFAYEQFHFSEAVEKDGVVYCSGAIGSDAKGRIPDDIKEEFRNAWRSITATLAAAGCDISDIVEYTSYHVGLQEHLNEFMAVRDEFISEPWPAWTAIGITELALAGAHVEVRVTASKVD